MIDCTLTAALQTPLNAEFERFPCPSVPVVAVAYSGGRDSTALLHALWRLSACQGTVGLGPFRILALHVHHGLSLLADHWLDHCQAQCEAWSRTGPSLALRYVRLIDRPSPGESIEAWARVQRYRALALMAQQEGCHWVLMAHHRQDQAETFLLQALRGAGPAGLSAMRARHQDAAGCVWLRPWLNQPRACLEAYVRAHGLSFVDDDSNLNPRFARNRLRLSVWPAWIQAFPGAEAALVQAAQRAQEAQAGLKDLAEIDLHHVAPKGPLLLAAWASLAAHRRANALQAWLAREPGLRVTRPGLERLLQELLDPLAGPAQWRLDQHLVRRYRGQLMLEPAQPAGQPWPPPACSLVVTEPGEFPVPSWGGRLRVFLVESGGLAWAPGMQLILCARQGGERFQSQMGRPPRSLKKHFQEAALPPWQRQAPLIYQGELLLFVPGLGLDARFVAPAGALQVGLQWEPGTPRSIKT
jgi:tRNA(Ile)-lysidine synthase